MNDEEEPALNMNWAGLFFSVIKKSWSKRKRKKREKQGCDNLQPRWDAPAGLEWLEPPRLRGGTYYPVTGGPAAEIDNRYNLLFSSCLRGNWTGAEEGKQILQKVFLKSEIKERKFWRENKTKCGKVWLVGEWRGDARNSD